MDKKIGFATGRKIHRWERSILEEGGLFLVGGSVRDLLAGKDEQIIDSDYIVTGIPLERLVTILSSQGRTDLVGRSFGVIKFKAPDGTEVDISLPRAESSTGPGHRDFEVTHDPSIPVEDDLVRRDFTINSIALDLADMRIIDPLGGREDLADSILRVNRETSFVEDPLRMLRGVQFVARFSLGIEKGTLDLMKEHAPLLAHVTPERLRMELDKLLTLASAPSKGFVLMHETGMLDVVLPELEACTGVEQNEFHSEDVFYHSLSSCDMAPPVLRLRLAALLHDLGKVSKKREIDGRTVFYGHDEEGALLAAGLMKRLAYSNELITGVAHLIRNHMFYITDEWSDSAVRRFVSRVGVENVEDLLALRKADGLSRGESGEGTMDEVAYSKSRVSAVLEKDSAFSRKDLAVSGSDLLRETDIEEGPEVGRMLDILLDVVLEEPAMNNAVDLMRIARRELSEGEQE